MPVEMILQVVECNFGKWEGAVSKPGRLQQVDTV